MSQTTASETGVEPEFSKTSVRPEFVDLERLENVVERLFRVAE